MEGFKIIVLRGLMSSVSFNGPVNPSAYYLVSSPGALETLLVILLLQGLPLSLTSILPDLIF